MVRVVIQHHILVGNLGPNWRNPSATAIEWATFLRRTWERDLRPLEYPLEINIVIEHGTTGVDAEPVIRVDWPNWDTAKKQEQVDEAVTPIRDIWLQFCETYTDTIY